MEQTDTTAGTLAEELAVGFALYAEGSQQQIEFILDLIEESKFHAYLDPDIEDRIVELAVSAEVPYSLDGPAAREQSAEEVVYRGLFVVSALDRLSFHKGNGTNPETLLSSERIFFDSHLRAANKRVSAAVTIDALAPTYNNVLSWYATRIDQLTLVECREAHLKNFRADDKPSIGWPGAVILRSTGQTASGCHCEPHPPVEGAEFLD